MNGKEVGAAGQRRDIPTSKKNMDDLLKYAVEHGMIDMSYVQEQIEMNKRKEILENHPYAIWQGKDGKWRTYLPAEGGKRTLKKRTTEKAIQDDIVNYYNEIKKEKREDYSFKSFFRKWEQVQISYGVVTNTVLKYKSDYIRYFEGTEFEKMDIRKITEEDITAFSISQIKKLGLKERAGKAMLGYINGTLKHARIKKIIPENPYQYVNTRTFLKFYDRTLKTPEERTINSNDMALLLEQLHASQKEKPYYMPNYAVEIGIYMGLRIGEIVALKWEDICENKGVIVIRRSEKHNRETKEYYVESVKTGKERQFPISPKISNLLKRVRDIESQYGFLGEYVFQNADGKLHASAVAHCIRYKCKKAGIPEKSIHAARRTLNSRLKCAGVSSFVAASMLGHTEKVNEMNYSYDVSDMDYKREVLSKII